MVIKDKFSLLKDIPNVLDMSSSSISSYTVKDGSETLQTVLKLMEKRISHFTINKVYKVLSNDKLFDIVNIPSYPLPISYNKKTKSIIININTFNVREITPTNPIARDLYSCMVYGICFSELVNGKTKVPDKLAPVISSFLLSTFIRVFGKEYGLLGIYSTQIPKLKFILNHYILVSFFGIKVDQSLRSAATVSTYDYRPDESIIRKINFSDIDGLIEGLSELKIMPGISKYNFASRILRFLTIQFMPAIEDCSRFISVLLTSSISGVTFTPAFYYRYNEGEFAKIIEFTKSIFR